MTEVLLKLAHLSAIELKMLTRLEKLWLQLDSKGLEAAVVILTS